MNDLIKSIKSSGAYHFSDDRAEILTKKMNQDLKNLFQWLKTNKRSLNVKKTELIIFHPKNTKLGYGVK